MGGSGSAVSYRDGNASQAIFLRTRWSWATDVPGSHDLVINFTLAAP
jgi:hypothetical protein